MIPRSHRLENYVEDVDTNVEEEEQQVMINLRIPMQLKIDCDNLYIERIKQNPKVRLTRSSVYREVFVAGVKKLMEDI